LIIFLVCCTVQRIDCNSNTETFSSFECSFQKINFNLSFSMEEAQLEAVAVALRH